MDTPDDRRLAYGITALARAVDVAPPTIRRAIALGDLKATRVQSPRAGPEGRGFEVARQHRFAAELMGLSDSHRTTNRRK